MTDIRVPDFVPMATVWLLLGFDRQPPNDATEEWLLTRYSQAARALEPDHLPRGILARQGMYEVMIWHEEIVGSAELDAAIRENRAWLHGQVEVATDLFRISYLHTEIKRIDCHVMRHRILLFDAGCMREQAIDRLDLGESGWRSPGRRAWLSRGG